MSRTRLLGFEQTTRLPTAFGCLGAEPQMPDARGSEVQPDDLLPVLVAADEALGDVADPFELLAPRLAHEHRLDLAHGQVLEPDERAPGPQQRSEVLQEALHFLLTPLRVSRLAGTRPGPYTSPP